MTQPLGQVDEGTLLWVPSPELVERSRITHYMHWLAETHGKRFATYDDLWRWSVDDLEGFSLVLPDLPQLAASLVIDDDPVGTVLLA